MNLPKLLESTALKQAMRNFNYNNDGVASKLKVLDCTYTPTPPIPHKKFREEFYGDFEKLNARMSKHKFAYIREHIPGAVFLDVDAALHPGPSQRFAAYEPRLFERYARLLGLNAGDHLVFYGRGGSLPAMLFAARMYWLFKAYGHDGLSVLNGGLNSWKDEHGFEVESSDDHLTPETKGNWTAKSGSEEEEFRVTYDELKDGIFDKLDEVNLLDARPRPQFEGKVETGFDPYFVEGAHIPGTKNVPAVEMIEQSGKMRSEDEIKEVLRLANFRADRPTYTMCMVGMQASLLSFALDSLSSPISTKLYAGSLYEIAQLEPKRISGGKQ